MKYILFISAIAFLTSCNKAKKMVEGMWSIDSIKYYNTEIRDCLYGNHLQFEKLVSFGSTGKRCPQIAVEYEEEGNWHIVDSLRKIYVVISSNNKLFAGTYRIHFIKDSYNKFLKMRLVSDNTQIVCRKGFYDYYLNENEIDDWVKKTQ